MRNSEQPSVADSPLHGSGPGSARNPYLAAALVAVALAAVVIAGALGPRPPSGASEATASHQGLPSPTATSVGGIPGYQGLGQLTFRDNSVRTIQLPAESSSSDAAGLVAIDGRQVFVARASAILEYDFDGSGESRVVKDFGPGNLVTALRISYSGLVALERTAHLSRAQLCDTGSCDSGYRVWLVSTEDGSVRELGAFQAAGASDPIGRYPVRLAAGTDYWAVSRPAPRKESPNATYIEVRDYYSGKLLWSTTTDAGLASLELGGARVLAVLDWVGTADTGSSTTGTTGRRSVAIGDSGNLVELGSVGYGASLSANGQYLAWDDGRCLEHREYFTGPAGSGGEPIICAPDQGVSYYAPSVDAGPNGKFTAVWLAIGSDGVRHLIFRSPLLAEDAVVLNAVDPDWAVLRNYVVYWANAGDAGIRIHSLDLGGISTQVR